VPWHKLSKKLKRQIHRIGPLGKPREISPTKLTLDRGKEKISHRFALWGCPPVLDTEGSLEVEHAKRSM